MDTCWHPRWRRQLFTGSQAWLEPERTGIKSHTNLLRAARTRTRIRFSSGPARGAARPPPPRVRGWGGVSCQNARLRALAALGERVRGSPQLSSGGLCEHSLAGSERTLLGGLGMRGRISASTEPRGRWGARQVCKRHRASRGWRSHLWESREPGLSPLSRGPLPHCGGRPPCSRDWGGAASQPEGTLSTTTPLPFASFLLGRALASQPAAGAPHSPHGPRSEGARLQRRLPMSRGGEIARRPQYRDPGRKAGGAQPACFSPGSAVRAACKNGQVKP